MNLINPFANRSALCKFLLILLLTAGQGTAGLLGQTNSALPTLRIQADQVVAHVSPMLYGLMTEEINYSYEGGLYGELIRNRSFKADDFSPVYWNAVGGGTIGIDPATPLNGALNVSLRLDATGATAAVPAGIANAGYWGIPVRPWTKYQLSFYAKAAGDFKGELTASLESADGRTVFAKARISGVGSTWKQFTAVLKTKGAPVSKNNIFKITTATPGRLWFQQVSLFPPTFDHRVNGNRPDLMQLLAAMKPAFLRLPGGNYLEGNNLKNRFEWRNTIGDPALRPGHRSPWGYWSTDGFGLMEYLHWCEDLHMEPLLAVFAGYTLNHQHVQPGPDLEPYVQDALDEIEYVLGDTHTKWGAQRALDGHAAPFPLHYVEVGNEDWFDKSGSYEGRFAQFFKAIKARYPDLKVIATGPVKSVTPDLLDEHYYRSEEEMEAHAHDYDRYPRNVPTKIFVGEWATREGAPTPNLAGALGDAAWMTGMERNSDIVLMSSYAPLFVNVSALFKGGSLQWNSDLIGYDALSCYGSPSYYAQQMFSTHHGDEVLATTEQDIPTYTWTPRPKRRKGVAAVQLPAQAVPAVFFDATRDSRSGKIYVKIVNRQATAQDVNIAINGVAGVSRHGLATVLRGESPADTNSLADPKKIVPATEKVQGLGRTFTRSVPPYSITVLELSTED